MADYKPLAVVALMCAIEPRVADAMREAGLAKVPLYVTPFPSRPEHQERFKLKLAEIIPKLPGCIPHIPFASWCRFRLNPFPVDNTKPSR
jgi:hypothetical protein